MRTEVKIALAAGLVMVAGAVFWYSSRPGNEQESLPFDRSDVDTATSETPIGDGVLGDVTREPPRQPAPAADERVVPASPAAPDTTDRSTSPPARRSELAAAEAEREAQRRAEAGQEANRLAAGDGRQDSSPTGDEGGFGDQPTLPESLDTTLGTGGQTPVGETAEMEGPPGEPIATGPLSPTSSARDTEPPRAVVTTPQDRSTTPDDPASPAGTSPPARRGTAEPAQAPRTHRVAQGDALIRIAEQYYGDGSKWRRIKEANPGLDEKRLLVGTEIIIPPLEGPVTTSPPARAGSDRSPRARGSTGESGGSEMYKVYVVGKGDTLIQIARNLFDDESRWREVYELNRDQLASPNHIVPGMELRVPVR